MKPKTLREIDPIHHILPRPHAQLCPVCNGKGVIADGVISTKKCHGCFGRGWVTVR